jgi:ABC-type glycerol-3-phosphate transport system permease component
MSAEAVATPKPRSAALKGQRVRRLVGSMSGQLLLLLVCAVVVLPCLFLFLGSFKSVMEFFEAPYALPKSWSLHNYTGAWKSSSMGTAFLNSFLVTSGSVLLSTSAAALASYAIARLRFRGASLLQLLFMSGLMIPPQLIILACFIEMRKLGILGTLWPLILMYTALAIPLGVLFLVGFFLAIPKELNEAAAIDGAGSWRQFFDVVLPLAKAPIFTVAILNSVWIWNDFFIPLIFSTTSQIQTVPIAILNFYGEFTTDYGLVFAGVIMSVIPVLLVYVLLTRRFIAGVTAGSIKG